jgi:polysaccharide biosynthesis protein PslH
MNILMIAPRFPYPPNRGGEITIFNFLAHLAATDNVTLVCYYDAEEELGHLPELKKYVSEIVVVKRPKKFSAQVLLRCLSGNCYMIARHTCSEMKRQIADLLSRQRFDLVQMESFLLVRNLPAQLDVPLVLDMHNVFFQIVERTAEQFFNPLVRLAAAFEVRRTKTQEAAVWRRADINLAVSESDRQLMWKTVGSHIRCEIVRPGAGLAHGPLGAEAVNPNRVLFIGSLHYHPNIDALTYFVREILPRLREMRGEIEVVVVGRDPTPAVVELLQQHQITLHANVPDVSPYLASAAVEVVPLRIAGGVRMKILEAMAAGKALVTTSIGCEGLPVRDNIQVLIRDDAASFADAVVMLLENPDRRMEIEAAARCLGETELSWGHTIKSLRQIHQRVTIDFGK